MRLSVSGLAVTFAVIWGGGVFLVAIANAIWPSYGQAFLDMVASIYPGYKAARNFGDIVTGTIYALFDGGIFGLLLGVIYNALARPKDHHHA